MIGEKDEFAHEDGKGELFGLSCSEEAEVERLENRVIAGGDERGHVESGADLGTTAADVAAAHAARVSRWGRRVRRRSNPCSAGRRLTSKERVEWWEPRWFGQDGWRAAGAGAAGYSIQRAVK